MERVGIFVERDVTAVSLSFMRVSSEMAFRTRAWRTYWWTSDRLRQVFILLFAFGWLAAPPVWADGCFVFKWNKAIDINEPTQKAIIVHDAGREDLLLQVKYEGLLEEFGWLIPVPSLPKVELGTMDTFYELNAFSQKKFGTTNGVVVRWESESLFSSFMKSVVSVIEIKTVGDYEVAILSARDASSLANWLRDRAYSLPEGGTEIVEEYVRQGWYFIAARVRLDRDVGFRFASNSIPRNSPDLNRASQNPSQLPARGELHPLLISFDSPKCVFPMKLSALAGKPSEVSIFLFSPEPQCTRFILEQACESLDHRQALWEQEKPEYDRCQADCIRQPQIALLRAYLFGADDRDFATRHIHQTNSWPANFEEIGTEGLPAIPVRVTSGGFAAGPADLLPCARINIGELPQCAKQFPRLNGGTWYLTKHLATFTPSEMRDLEFEPAIPHIRATVGRPGGRVAAELLAKVSPDPVPLLLDAAASANPSERFHALRGLFDLQIDRRTQGSQGPDAAAPDARLVEPLLRLLKDESPKVRLTAMYVADLNWNARFVAPMLELLRDSEEEIRSEAGGCLATHAAERVPAYLELLKDDDFRVRRCACRILMNINRQLLPDGVAMDFLRNSDPNIQNTGLHLLLQLNRNEIPRSDLLPILSGPRIDSIILAVKLLEGRIPPSRATQREVNPLASRETARLTTNRLAEARYVGLKVLERNADATAVELVLPLLRDMNSVVRNRAFAVLKKVSGKNISDDDPVKWGMWWAANKNSFKSRQSAQ